MVLVVGILLWGLCNPINVCNYAQPYLPLWTSVNGTLVQVQPHTNYSAPVFAPVFMTNTYDHYFPLAIHSAEVGDPFYSVFLNSSGYFYNQDGKTGVNVSLTFIKAGLKSGSFSGSEPPYLQRCLHGDEVTVSIITAEYIRMPTCVVPNSTFTRVNPSNHPGPTPGSIE